MSFGCGVIIRLADNFYCLFSLFIHKLKMSVIQYLWFSVLGYIVTVGLFHLESLFLCLHIRLICALNYYLLTYLQVTTSGWWFGSVVLHWS